MQCAELGYRILCTLKKSTFFLSLFVEHPLAMSGCQVSEGMSVDRVIILLVLLALSKNVNFEYNEM